jgi:hypothetical protein
MTSILHKHCVWVYGVITGSIKFQFLRQSLHILVLKSNLNDKHIKGQEPNSILHSIAFVNTATLHLIQAA